VSDLSPPVHLASLISFVANTLPRLNTACRDAVITLDDWMRTVHPVVAGTDMTAVGLGGEDQLLLLQVLGFVVGSGERHAQFAGHEPGWVVRKFPGLAHALVTACAGCRVPALTAELYWERNGGPRPLSFTDEPHELFFISAVRTQVALRAAANRQ